MKLKFLEDGCKWCGSQEWNEDLSDVDHGDVDCPAPFLMKLGAGEYGELEDAEEIARRLTGDNWK